MKLLKAKTSHPKKQIFQISDLNYNLYYTNNNSKLVNGAEDILEAVKPILAKYEVALVSNDEMVELAGRVYVKTTVMLAQDNTPFASASAFAREALEKKGMDVAQITGSSASYSSKRALGNLLCISDSALDPDKTNKHGKDSPATKKVAKTNNTLI